MGDPREARGLFAEIDAPEISLHVRPDVAEAIAGLYTLSQPRAMRRMTLQAANFRPASHHAVGPIDEGDLSAVTSLYADGHRRGEGPTFFHPSMLRQHSFCGLWEQGALIAIAGTHLYSPALGVCAIGNVYTRSDRRGRGHGGQVTSAVVSIALRDAIPTIVLNVGHANTAAQRVYERLGFGYHGDFVEGDATRVMSPPMTE